MNRRLRILTRSIAALVCGSATSLALDNNWTGATSIDWNTDVNWSDPHGFGNPHVPNNGAGHPGDEDAVVNISTGNIATITANFVATPRDIKVGIGAGTNGQVNHLSGTASTGGGAWTFIGVDGGTGRYNLANTAGTGGTFTGMGTGSGSLNAGGADLANGRLYIGGHDNTSGGTGTLNFNTTGTLKVGNDIFVGRGGGLGVVNIDAGTVNRTSGSLAVGHLAGSDGTVRISGGALNGTGTSVYGQAGGTGRLLMAGGSHNSTGEMWFGNDPGSTGLATINGGALSSGSSLTVGRNGSTGTLTINGGSVSQGSTDAASRLGLTNLNAGGTGTVNLNGGTLTTNGIVHNGGASATSVVNFNGGTLIPRANQADFMEGLTAANVQAGGVNIDANGFAITISQPLVAGGIGGVTKLGAGDLTLDATNTYSGGTTVSGGALLVAGTGGKLGTGNVNVLSTAITLNITTGVTNAIADTATVFLAGGGVAGAADFGFATLGAGINDTVSMLVLGGVLRAPGTYGSTASLAMFKNDEFFSGLGTLTVLIPEPTAALLVAGGLGVLLGRRRRHRR